MKKTFIPEEFREKFSRIMGGEAETFFGCCSMKMPKSIWVNSLKIAPGILARKLRGKGWVLNQLPFHENAFALEGIERPAQCGEFEKGLFNLQEKASMLPAIILAPREKDLVLDAAAAPGNKTLQLSCIMNGHGKIVAIDKNVQRFKSLKFNAKKFGMKNVLAQRSDLLSAKRENLFDKVLLDAPCSSEGLVRKNFDALKNWSGALVERKAALQEKMLWKALRLLKPGGTLVYSTCSLSPEENEMVVQRFVESGKAEMLEVKINGFKIREGFEEYGGVKFDSGMKKAVRIYPQDNNSQAFFIAKMRKIST